MRPTQGTASYCTAPHNVACIVRLHFSFSTTPHALAEQRRVASLPPMHRENAVMQMCCLWLCAHCALYPYFYIREGEVPPL